MDGQSSVEPTNPRSVELQMDKIKQVIILRKDLGMRRGKSTSQGAHASLSCILQLLKRTPVANGEMTEYKMFLEADDPVHLWLSNKFTKIVVSVNSEEALLNIYKEAKDRGLLCSLIQDAGDTEFHGVSTYTAVAIGPDYSSKVDLITGHLPLL